MKASILLCSALLLSASLSAPFSASAQSGGKRAAAQPVLFIDSNPIGAAVVVDGKPLDARTPLLLRNLKPGNHSLSLVKFGYAPWSGTTRLSAGKVMVVDQPLSDESFAPRFDPSDRVYINGVERSYKDGHYRLPDGEYRITRSGRVVSVEPIFPAQQMLGIVDLTTGLLLTGSVVSAANELLNPSSSGNGAFTAVYIATGVLAVTDTLLHYKKSQFHNDFRVQTVPNPGAPSLAETEFSKAQELLTTNDLTGASELYVRVLEDHADSPYFPRALYQLAKIHSIQGNNFLAQAELRLILEKYPSPDLYDKSCKSLADLSDRQGDYKLALSYLDKMVFLDPLFSRKQIDDYRAAIEKQMAAGGSGS